MKKSGICKTIGVILLVVFGSIACFFGGVSLIEYGYGWGSEEYLQSSSAQEAVDYNIYNKYGYAISEKKVNDSAVEAFVREISENFDYYVEKYDAKTKSYVSLAESKNYTEDSDYPLVKKYGIGDITDADNRRIFEGDAFENSNVAYIVHVGVNEPTINDDTQFYQRYQVYKMVKPYTENAVTYTVASATVILILLVYETIAAGHTKEEGGIHLSWIDRIPFDVFTFVMILVGCCICLIGSELLSSVSYMMFYEASMDFVEAGLPLIAFVILLALVVYVYYISFVVRIKSHTLISNNVIVKAIQFVYYPVKKVIVEFYDAYCHSASMSAWIQVRDPEDAELMDRVYKILKEIKDDPQYNIGYLFTKEEASEKYGLEFPKIDFVIEGKEPMSFDSTLSGKDLFEEYLKPGWHHSLASHGYLSFKDQTTTFIACGPSVKKGVVIERSSMVNEASTMAKMVGYDFDGTDGSAWNEMLQD